MTTYTTWPSDAAHAREILDTLLDRALWQPVHRIHLDNLMDWTEWDGWEVFLGVDWERDFGTIRSLAAKPDWHQVDRLRLHLLLYLAIKHDEARYRQEWLPYMSRDPRMRLYAQSLGLTRDIAHARDWGSASVYFCPTQKHMDQSSPHRSDMLCVEYGFDSTSHWQKMTEKEAIEAIDDGLSRWMGDSRRLTPVTQSHILIERFLEHLPDVRSWIMGNPLSAHATFSYCVVALGADVSGFVTFWDED